MEQVQQADNQKREIVDMTGRKIIVPNKINSVFAASLYGYTMLTSIAPELIPATPFPPRNCDKKYLPDYLQELPVIDKITKTEEIAQIKPDVVLVWADKDKPYHKKSEIALESIGQTYAYVIIDNLGDVPDFAEAYEFLGRLLGKEARGAKLANYCREAVAEVSKAVSEVPEAQRPGVYYAEGNDGLMTEYDDSLHAHLLKLLGDVNLVRGHMTEHKGLEQFSLQQIKELNPDIIIAWSREFTQRVIDDPNWKSIKAVHNKKVYPIPNIPFNWVDRPPCFMRILGMKWLANLLYPNNYQIDIVKETQKFYSLFLNVSLTAEDTRKILYRANH